MTMPPIHHGRADGPGPGLRTAWIFVATLFTCSLIGFWSLRLFGVGRGEVGWGTVAVILALATVAAALITRFVRNR
ncbi:hypothetical protein AAG742_09405 [Micrococcus sp. 2A]|uniref:hypothetical protein n=1 Tax=Micrococcus sp. 2A TaxID=3142261 RepID=UPI00262E83BD|nr:hypothetical protein [uncultured Micrococcus sp.]